VLTNDKAGIQCVTVCVELSVADARHKLRPSVHSRLGSMAKASDYGKPSSRKVVSYVADR